jgi:hypothetical protein
MSYDFKTPPKCQTCNNNYYYWSNWSKFFDLAPFIVDANDLIGIKPSDANVKLWNIQKNGYTYAKNYGLNLDISVKCDVTDFFCREKYLFADVLNKQVTVDVLEELSKSTRNNVISKEVQQLALYELNNKDGSNARIRLEKSIKAIGFDLSDLNESCLPCNEKWGPTWGAV